MSALLVFCFYNTPCKHCFFESMHRMCGRSCRSQRRIPTCLGSFFFMKMMVLSMPTNFVFCTGYRSNLPFFGQSGVGVRFPVNFFKCFYLCCTLCYLRSWIQVRSPLDVFALLSCSHLSFGSVPLHPPFFYFLTGGPVTGRRPEPKWFPVRSSVGMCRHRVVGSQLVAVAALQ